MIDFDTKARQLSQHLIVPKSKQPVESQPQQAEMSAKNLNWMRLIIEFFELQHLATREKEAALRIEEFFCNIRRQRVRTRFLKLHYKHQGLQCSMRSLPRELLVKIASFLTPKELLSKFCGVSKVFKSVSQSPNLWRNISTFAQKESGQFLHNYNYLMQLVSRSTQLQILSLKYCQHVNEETLEIIAQQANPFFLRQLYLDGCERVDDNALLKLTTPKSTMSRTKPDFITMFKSCQSFAKEL
jgi:hypothetical protein